MAEQCEGRVIRKVVGSGTKSERLAVVLETGEDELVLRRQGGNAFEDAVLESLVGHRIRGSGERTGYTFILFDWEDLGGRGGHRR